MTSTSCFGELCKLVPVWAFFGRWSVRGCTLLEALSCLFVDRRTDRETMRCSTWAIPDRCKRPKPYRYPDRADSHLFSLLATQHPATRPAAPAHGQRATTA